MREGLFEKSPSLKLSPQKLFIRRRKREIVSFPPKTIVFGIKISLNDPIPRRKRGQNFLFKESFLSVSLDKNTTNVL
jgi:hypothetical protein